MTALASHPLVPLSEDTITRLLALRSTSTETIDEIVQALIASSDEARPSVRLSPTNASTGPRKPNSTARSAQAEQGLLFELFGSVHYAHNAKEAYLSILRQFACHDSTFCARLALRIAGRTRNHLASRRDRVYPRRPDLDQYVVELVPGWFVGTNIANREKIAHLKEACAIANKIFGRDLRIELPTAETLDR